MNVPLLRSCLLCVAVIAGCLPTSGQTTPFLPDDEIRMLTNELSGDRAFEHIRVLSRWHRDSGMDGFFKAADYVMEAAREAGLEDVRFIEQPMDGANYTAHAAELWMVEPVEWKLADLGDHATLLADKSRSADVTAELIWVGNGSQEALEGLDVKGKIVLTSGPAWGSAVNAVYGRGAVGIISFQPSEGKNPMEYPDQIAWSRIPENVPEGKQGTFAFTLSPRKGETLRKVLETKAPQDFFATGKKSPGGRVVVRAKVNTEFGSQPGRTGFVEAWIRGAKYPDEHIVLTAHLQEEQGSANDDGSGCANLLEFGRTYVKLIHEGKVQRPLRSIRLWWTDEISSEYRYFQDHPAEVGKFFANLHQDMTGADQALGSRVQHLIFAPHSRTSYLDAIFESIGTYVILTNNGFLAASRQGGLPRPHTRPIYATRGSRQGYQARFVPYFGSSDHMCFVEGAIGVPAVAMINWDDDFIHSSDDDLDKIDRTQLQRNNFIITAMAHVLAHGEADLIPTLAAETFAQGMRRLANDARVAMESVVGSNAIAADGWKEGLISIEQGVLREIRALRSVRAFAPADRNIFRMVDGLVDRMRRKEEEMRDDLAQWYRQKRGRAPGTVSLTPEERNASRKVPKNFPSLKTYFSNRHKDLPATGLHGLMLDEVFNFVDGQRSYFDIYKAVYAEAAAAGTWYYGSVTLEGVTKALDSAVLAGAIELVTR